MRHLVWFSLALVFPAAAAQNDVTLYERELLCRKLGGETRWALREYPEIYYALAHTSPEVAAKLVKFAKEGKLDHLPERVTVLMAIARSADCDMVATWVMERGLEELRSPAHVAVWKQAPSEYARQFKILEGEVARQASRPVPEPEEAPPRAEVVPKWVRDQWVGLAICSVAFPVLILVFCRRFAAWRRRGQEGE